MLEKTKSILQRDLTIDIVKAIGIILMVFYHAGTPGNNFVYLFHMALFFICSGYCYSHKSEKNPWTYIKRKMLTLYLPFVISCILVVSLQNLFLDVHVYSNDVYNKLTFSLWLKEILKCFFFVGARQMLGANWFFRTLFISSVLFMFLNRILNSLVKKQSIVRLVRFFICLLLTTIGGVLGSQLPLGKYFNFMTVMILLDTGLQIKELNLLIYFDTKIKKIIAVSSCFLLLLVLNQYGDISINSNIIINPAYFLICSLAGFVMVYLIADFISTTKLKDYFIYLGRNTLWIMFFHYIGFKIVTFVEIFILHEPIENLAAYPTHHTANGMWMIYGLAGIIIPMLMVTIGKKIKNMILKGLSLLYRVH